MSEASSEGTIQPPEPQSGADQGQQPSEPDESSEGPTWAEIKRLRQESAQRRHRTRELEAERDQLRGRVAAADRAEVERMLGDRLVDPSDFWLGGAQLKTCATTRATLTVTRSTRPRWR